jgi:hypothetical protein
VVSAVELAAEARQVEPDLARVGLERGAVERAVGGEQAVVERPEAALGRGGQRGLGRQRAVLRIEQAVAVDDAYPVAVQQPELLQRLGRLRAVAAEEVGELDDRDRRVDRAERRPVRGDAIHRPPVEARLGDRRAGQRAQQRGGHQEPHRGLPSPGSGCRRTRKRAPRPG